MPASSGQRVGSWSLWSPDNSFRVDISRLPTSHLDRRTTIRPWVLQQTLHNVVDRLSLCPINPTRRTRHPSTARSTPPVNSSSSIPAPTARIPLSFSHSCAPPYPPSGHHLHHSSTSRAPPRSPCLSSTTSVQHRLRQSETALPSLPPSLRLPSRRLSTTVDLLLPSTTTSNTNRRTPASSVVPTRRRVTSEGRSNPWTSNGCRLPRLCAT